MTTLSFPITGENITHSEWTLLFRRGHQGVDTGMTLSLSSTSNDATISTGRCFFLGFMLQVTDAHIVTLPAVTSTTTYVIGIMYEPANEADPQGPLAITSGVKGSVSVPAGGAFWPLYEVTRQPSQTLNLAATTSYRVTRGSLLISTATGADPDPSFTQGPQVLVRPEGIKLWNGGSWQNVKSDTGDVTTGFTAASGWSNAGSAGRILDGQCILHLRATRTGSALTATANGSFQDQALLTVPSAMRPTWTETGRGSVTASGASSGIDWRLYNTGIWYLTSSNPSLAIPAGSTIFATVSFTI